MSTEAELDRVFTLAPRGAKDGDLQSTSAEGQQRLARLREVLETLPAVHLDTVQKLYAGCYSRTLFIPAGTVVESVEIKCATQLVVVGHARFSDGDHTTEVNGVHVFTGLPGRKGACYAISDVVTVMFFASGAKTFDEAEHEFTNEVDDLLTTKERK